MPKTNGQSKTNVTARLVAKKKAEPQKPKVLDLSGMRSSMTGTVTAFPKGFLKRQPENDEERRIVASFEAHSKEIKRANPKTAGHEQGYAEDFRSMRRLGLVD